MNKVIIVSLVALFSSAALAGELMADAATGSSDVEALWKTLDVDGDGFLSKQEGEASLTVGDSWNAIDTDQDDKISKAEFVKSFSMDAS
ncbi:MAG: hypothetical protein COB26_06580 [Piscirickettsiaceae bacterium]|nr:MAG: hypothetical protein COB26_06580 [Piscirickettsiaceae bacterium]